MLHQINLPACSTILENILLFQKKVLLFACNTNYPLTREDNTVLCNYFDEPTANWLWNRLWKGRSSKKTKIGKNLEKLICYINNNQNRRELIVKAFDNDTNFHNNLQNRTFNFNCLVELNKKDIDAIKPLLTTFYTNILRRSCFPSYIHDHDCDFDRKTLIASFWDANPELEVCPACDGDRPAKFFGSVDHFFPESKYPCLSIHPANLIPICGECNSDAKGDRDPIDNHRNEPLFRTFHPYFNPAKEHLKIELNKNSIGLQFVRLTSKTEEASISVKNLNRIYQLERRWQDKLKREISKIRDELSEDFKKFGDKNKPLTKDGLKKDLQSKRDKLYSSIGKKSYVILDQSYIQFLLDNDNEIEDLMQEFQ